MSRPRIFVDCDKCGTEYDRLLKDVENTPLTDKHYIYLNWLPPHWHLHNTEDDEGPEPHKIFILCDKCEEKFQNSVRTFQS